jgi:2-polyprenyl-3-methyl-5-hydroxy-6-metoxy-1,4-benzoquinol methylase
VVAAYSSVYFSAIKRLAKRILHRLGYEVRRVGSLETDPPPWMHLTRDFRPSERMANRTYRPLRVERERMPYFGDARVKYLLYFMDFRDLRVLELGPREGHHSIMLEKMGAREVVALEGRRENLELCMRTKERYRLDRTSFHLADVEALAEGRLRPPFEGTFDLVFCAGLLYHLREPARVLEWCRRQAPTLFLQTHYIEEAASTRYSRSSFQDATYSHGGHEYRAKIFEEEPGNPRTGLRQTSVWLHERDLLALIKLAGFEHVSVLGKDVHWTLPHITILAESSSADSRGTAALS